MSAFSKAHREYWSRQEVAIKAERCAELYDHRAKRHERRMKVLKRYGYIAPVSVGAGILTAVAFAIGTHLTMSGWRYAVELQQEGYPPLWLWAGVAAALVIARVLLRWQSGR